MAQTLTIDTLQYILKQEFYKIEFRYTIYKIFAVYSIIITIMILIMSIILYLQIINCLKYLFIGILGIILLQLIFLLMNYPNN